MDAETASAQNGVGGKRQSSLHKPYQVDDNAYVWQRHSEHAHHDPAGAANPAGTTSPKLLLPLPYLLCMHEGMYVGERSNFKNFLRTRKIMVMHSNERGECDLRTLVDRQRKR